MINLRTFCGFFEQLQYKQNDSFSNSSDLQLGNTDMPFKMFANYSKDAIQSICSKLEHDAESVNSPITGYLFIKYSYPLLLLFGLCGNALTFLVMCRVHNRKRNFQKFSLSLGTLALADIAILIFGCLIDYLEEVAGLTVKALSPASCKLTLFACYLFSCYSAYLHAFIAVERWNAISRPLSSLTRFTFKTNRLILGALFLLCIIINLPLLWFPSVNPIAIVDESTAIGLRTLDECQIQQDFILALIDSFFNCLMPFSLTVIFSILTLIKLIHIKSTASAVDTNEEININHSPNKNSTDTASTYSPTRIHVIQGSSSFKKNQGSQCSKKLKVLFFNTNNY